MSTTVDWSGLPPELLLTVATFLNSIADYICFRAVCRNWRNAAPITRRYLPREFPWLMLPLSSSSNHRLFFNPLTRNLHRLSLPEASLSCRRAGSSHGWLILIDESPSIFIINPLTRAKIMLPPLSSFPNVAKFDLYSIGREYTVRSPDNVFYYYYDLKEMRDNFIKKVILSHNPQSRENFFAFAIAGEHGYLCYCKNGDDCWTVLDETHFYYEDVIYFNGAFYAVDKFGSIAICDVNDVSPSVKTINMVLGIGGDIQYLVDAMGELCLVSRYLEFDIDINNYSQVCKTVKFCVFRLDKSAWKWERILSLEDKVFFLGQNSSFSLLISDYSKCQGNRIYFTDDYSGTNIDGINDHDIGVYNLADGSIESLPCYPRNSHWPIWLTPSLC